MIAHLLMLRPQQWTKNLLVLAALLFAGQISDPMQCFRALNLFVAFCLVSSGVYVINDLKDRETDRLHPRKRHRPIASGSVKAPNAVIIALVLFAAGLSLAWTSTLSAFASVLAYLALQAAYTTALKHVVILDVIAVSAGFVLRAAAGALAIQVSISPWLLICTILLALFLGLSKRRSELLAPGLPLEHRRVLNHYSVAFLDQLIAIVTSCTLLSYILYTFSEQTMQKFASHLMPLTLPFVLYGIFRYLYLIYMKSEGGEPEMLLLKDLPLLLDVAFWGLTVILIVSLD